MDQKIKVVFINETTDDWLKYLTLHKVYEAEKWDRYYLIYYNEYNWKYYDMDHFVTLAEWRAKQIDKILEDE